MEKLLKKLSSRKFWAAVAGFVAGLAMAFGLDENNLDPYISYNIISSCTYDKWCCNWYSNWNCCVNYS